jgi:hypothetical protein
MRIKTCRNCQDNDPTVQYRVTLGAPLCSACYVDACTSSTRAVRVETRDHNDRYTRMAKRFGL